MRSIVFTLVLLTYAASSLADTDQLKPLPDLSGIYELQGVETGGPKAESYAGLVVIKKQHDGYLMQWTAGPGSNAVGIAALEDGILTCAWTHGQRLGLTRYKIDKAGKVLIGKWMTMPMCKWQSETLTFRKPFPKAKDIGQVGVSRGDSSWLSRPVNGRAHARTRKGALDV